MVGSGDGGRMTRCFLAGSALWIGWNIYQLILAPHTLVAIVPIDVYPVQFTGVLGFICGATVVVCLGEQRLIRLYRSRAFVGIAAAYATVALSCYAFVVLQGPTELFLALFCALNTVGLWITVTYLNAMAVVSRTTLFKVMGASSALGAAWSLVLFLSEGGLGGALLGLVTVLLSLVTLRQAQVLSLDGQDDLAFPIEVQQRRFVMPRNVLAAGALFTMVIGIVASLYDRFKTLPGADALQTGWEAVGMMLASLAFIAVFHKAAETEERAHVASQLSLILITCGLFLLQVTSFSIPVASNLVFAAGFVLFYLYIKSVYFDIAWRTPALPMMVFAQGFLANYLISLVGGLVALVLPERLLQPPYAPLLMMGVFLLLSITSVVCFSGKNLATCWGLVSSERDRPKKEGSFQAVVDRLSEETALTPREREVLVLLARGYRAAQIAATLGISYGTVRTHINHIYQKLQIHTYAELCDLVAARKDALAKR